MLLDITIIWDFNNNLILLHHGNIIMLSFPTKIASFLFKYYVDIDVYNTTEEYLWSRNYLFVDINTVQNKSMTFIQDLFPCKTYFVSFFPHRFVNGVACLVFHSLADKTPHFLS